MFHINDLNDMDDSQIRETAESMGIKKASSLSRDEIMNQILDLQAEVSAKDFVSKASDKKKSNKDKDGRTKRAKKSNETDTQTKAKTGNPAEHQNLTLLTLSVLPWALHDPATTSQDPGG